VIVPLHDAPALTIVECVQLTLALPGLNLCSPGNNG
jgi:hypothetical protein